MGKFRVIVAENAIEDIRKHIKSGNKSVVKKIETILIELEEHPYSGTGHPEQLKHQFTGKWSRRINKKDRLIYTVNEEIVFVEVLSAIGHYIDK